MNKEVVHPIRFEVMAGWHFEIEEGIRQRSDNYFRELITLYFLKEDLDKLQERVNEFKEEQGKLHKNVRIDKLKIEPLGTIHINTIEEEGNG